MCVSVLKENVFRMLNVKGSGSKAIRSLHTCTRFKQLYSTLQTFDRMAGSHIFSEHSSEEKIARCLPKI